jgi:phosphoserine phosphatase
MYILSLIARPSELDPSLVLALQTATGGGDAIWLAPDEAAEIELQTPPSNLDELRAQLSGMPVDLNLLPAAGRRKRLLIADMDSTMIEQECIDELAAEAGVGDHVAGITARAMNGELDFEEALTERVGLLKGLDEAVIARVLRDRITDAPGGATLVATMKADGAITALVSGGFTSFTSVVAKRLGFQTNRANRLEIVDGTLTGRVVPPILGREAKVEALTELASAHGFGPEDALAVGDGANDLGMIGAAGMGVALHAKPSVAEVAPLRVDHGDLTALLYLQGYAKEEFR